jgi:selenocysteine lyase/cysteine desulfurase
MNDKKEANTTKIESRRSFLKTKLLGSLAFVAGVPSALMGDSKSTLFRNYKERELSLLDWNEIRKEFSFKPDIHYFNTASHGPTPVRVVKQVCTQMEDLEQHLKLGDGQRKTVYTKISTFLNCEPDEVAVTTNATESMNIIARSIKLTNDDEIIITDNEHIGGSAPWVALHKELGVKIKIVKLDLTGKDNLKRIQDAISPRTKVVSLSHVTCTTGLCLPVKDIVKHCRKLGIYSCIDGAQALGMIPVDLKNINPDFYAGCGHKWLMGPKGTGILYINKDVIHKCTPTFVGAYSDSKFDLQNLVLEYRQSADRHVFGTRNIPTLSGLATAIDFVSKIGVQKINTRGRALAKYFRNAIQDMEGVEILSSEDGKYATSILTIRFKHINNYDIRVNVAKEFNFHFRYIHENNLDAIRLSFAIYNTEEEIDKLVAILKRIADKK